MGKKLRITMDISIGLAIAYFVNASFCVGNTLYQGAQKGKTPAFKEYWDVVQPEIQYHRTALNSKYSMGLSEESRNNLEKRLTVLEEKEKGLLKEMRPYDEKMDKWSARGRNPLNYFK